MMEVKIKRLSEKAVIPHYAHDDDAGLDLIATSYEYKQDIDCHVYGTGLAVEIPKDYVGLIYPRSSNRNTNAYMTNHVGILDSGYRGEIMISFKNRCMTPNDGVNTSLSRPYEVGNKIAQLIIIPYPKIHFIEVDELSDSDRKESGHGSTGK